jgi:hypothetical protein
MAEIPDLSHDRIYTGKSEGQMPVGRHLMMVNYVDGDGISQAGNSIHKVEFVGIDNPNEGKVAKENFNLDHEIGRGKYKGMIACLGFSSFVGLKTDQLHGKLLYVRIEHEPFTTEEGQVVQVAKAVGFRGIPRDTVPTTSAPVVGQREGAKPAPGKPTWREKSPVTTPPSSEPANIDEAEGPPPF